jgi:predicted enzyme related to lactoylglutathione lyase
MTVRDTPWPDGTPCWVDLMTTDAEAARAFYAGLFGWELAVGPAETGFYALASVDGHEVCGIGTAMNPDQPPAWTTYFAAGDVDATTDNIVRAGGTILVPPMDVMEFGRQVIAQDPTGAAFGVWQANKHIGYTIANEPNTLTWNELLSREYSAALEFYAAVFSYSFTDLSADGFDYSTAEVSGSTVAGIGMMPPNAPAELPAHWRAYFAVEDTDAALAKAVALGAQVTVDVHDSPYGRWGTLADPQGAQFSVIKPASPQ